MIVGIIGVGRVGSRVAEELITNFSPSEIWLENRSGAKVQGILLSLRVWAHSLRRPVIVKEWPRSRAGLDLRPNLIVIAVKDSYDPRILFSRTQDEVSTDLRYVGLQRDLPLIHDACSRLVGYRGIVVVVTNPVDVLTEIVHRRLPTAFVVGSGLELDRLRLRYVLRRNSSPRDVTRLLLAGEHGGPMFAIGEPSNHTLERALKASAMIGKEIVRHLGFSLHDCGKSIVDDVRFLLTGRSTSRSLSLTTTDGFSIGRPLTRRQGRFIVATLASGDVKRLASASRRVREVTATLLKGSS